jgi:hypothetical protein
MSQVYLLRFWGLSELKTKLSLIIDGLVAKYTVTPQHNYSLPQYWVRYSPAGTVLTLGN